MDLHPGRLGQQGRQRFLILLAVALAAVLAACAGAATQVPDDGAGAPAATAAPAFDSDTKGEQPAPDDGTNGRASTSAERLIVRTGQLSLRVKDLDAALAEAARAIEALGGYVAASERTGEDDTASATVTYRLPAARWDDGLAAVRNVGEKVLGEQTSSQEVTDQVVDLGARLVNLRATEAALQKIMDKATKIPDILEVQAQLASVREQIERLEAEKQRLEQAAALATLSVSFTLPPPVAVARVQEGWDPAREADRAAATLVEMGQGAVNVGIWLVIVWLPLLVLVAIVALVAYVVVRRLRRRPPLAPPGSPAPDLPAEAGAR